MTSELPSTPIGLAGSGALALTLASRIVGSPGTGRVIIHGIALPERPAAANPATKRRLRIERAANLFDLASECEIVITAYETHLKLIEALAGSPDRPGLIGALVPGSLIADFTPAEPHEVRRLAGALAPRAVGLVECAIAGTPRDEHGAAMIFAGGYGEHVDRLTPVLSHLGTSVQRSGTQGSACLAAANIELQRLMNALAARDWHALSRDFTEGQPGTGETPPDHASLRTQLTGHLAFLRSAAAMQGVTAPFLDALAETLASDGLFKQP